MSETTYACVLSPPFCLQEFLISKSYNSFTQQLFWTTVNECYGTAIMIWYSGCALIVQDPYRSVCPLSFSFFWKESSRFPIFLMLTGFPLSFSLPLIVQEFWEESLNDKGPPTVLYKIIIIGPIFVLREKIPELT